MGSINEATIAGYVNPSNSQDVHTDSLNQILLAFHQKKISLPQLVQLLGEHLTNLDELVRSRGTLLLSEVLTRLPTYPLDTNAVHFLVGFFSDRIQDYPCVGEVMKGVVALVRNHAIADADVETIIRTIFQEVQPQALPQSQRKMVLDAIEILMQKYLPIIKSLSSDFVYGILQIIDGEKDPRNLIVAFRIFYTTLREIPGHERFTEDLFEVVSCYFPITFKPRADDPDAISKEALVDALRKCLFATPAFAPLCYPFLLDKLASSSTDAKIESMLTLESSVENFGGKVTGPFLADIWGALRAEVLTGKEAEVVEQGLSTIKAVTRILSTDLVHTTNASSTATELTRFLSPLVTDSTKQLGGPADSKLASTSSRILSAAASASVPACAYVVDQVLPIVFKQLNEANVSTPSSRQSLIDVLPALLSASKSAVPAGYAAHPLSQHANDLHEHLSLALVGSSASIISSAILGLTALSLLSLSFPSTLLHLETVGSVISRITSVASDSDVCSDANVFSRCVDSLVSLARAAPNLILEHCLPVLLQRVRLSAATALTSHHAPSHDHTAAQEHDHSHAHGHDHSHGHGHSHHGHSHGPSHRPSQGHDHTHDKEGQLYSAIAALCVAPSIHVKVTSELVVMIRQLLQEDAKLPAADPPVNLPSNSHQHDSIHIHARDHQKQAERAFACLADAITKNVPDQDTIAQFCQNLIPGIISTLVDLVTSSSSSSPSGFHRSAELYLPHCLRIARIVVQKAEDDIQLELFNNLTSIFLRGTIASFNPTLNSAPQTQLQLIVIYATIISQAKPSVIGSLPISEITTCLLSFFENPLVATATSQCVASIVNKVSEGEFLSKFLAQIVDDQLVSAIQSPTASSEDRVASLKTLIWILKALVQRDHPSWRGIAAVLINLVGFPGGQPDEKAKGEIAEVAANAFDVILAESEDGFLSKSSGAVIRVLYKQKFFTVVYPQLLESFKTTSSFLYLVAIGNLLRHIPRPVLLSELPTIIPLLIQSLRHPSSSSDSHQVCVLQTSTASTVLMLLKEAPDMISDHTSTFITELLHLSTDSPFADVRCMSLKCIAKFSTLPFIKIFPHKAKVTITLQKCLDDKKRTVRREAVKARNQWFVLAETKQHHGHAH